MDFKWPSEAKRTQALIDGTFKPQLIYPRFMAVFRTRIFLSIEKFAGVPVSLVSLPTSSASSAPPKLIPFPSRKMHRMGGCNKIEEARGLQVDSVGRLWVLDRGSDYCNAKLWIFDLSNNVQTEHRHQFSFRYKNMHDLVLEETPNGTLAYITYWGEENIVVFSLERKESWIVQTPGNIVYSVALSPKSKEEPRKLYLTNLNSNELFSIPVTALRKEARTAYPTLFGKWTTMPYRLVMDNHGTMYAAFWWKHYIRSKNKSQPFEEQTFYEVENLGTSLAFTFALDSSGTFWMTELNKTGTKPRYRLLKAAIGALSITTSSPTNTSISPKTEPKPASLSIPTTTTTTTESTPITAKTLTRTQNATEKVENCTQLPEINHTTPDSLSIPTTTKSRTPAEENAATEVQESSTLTENWHHYWLFNIILICAIVISVILFSLTMFSFILRKKNYSRLQNTNDVKELSIFCDDKDDVGHAEVQIKEVTNETRPLEQLLHLVPTSRRFVSARDLSESDTSEAEDGEIWRGV
ncbi:protein yellow-like [Cloeon dipterum]|uniref:protein yellow-like n=1 Tax=Cloeon dipterum TaxID=197152 RepID=UPI00321F7454